MALIYCHECKTTKPAPDDVFMGARLMVKRLCFECDYWRGVVELKDAPDAVRVEGHAYMIAERIDERPDTCGEPDHVIEFFDGRRVETSHLFFLGTIPEKYRAALPDNAAFKYERGKP